MGKKLLKAYIRRRKLRRALPCKRFCSCCSESSIKPSPQKSGRSPPTKQGARKFGKTVKGSNIASDEVKQLKNIRKSVRLSRGWSVRAHLKQLIVNVTRLSEDVLRVLSENGSIRACNVSTEGVCKLSGSKAGKDSCFATPSRRLRSTQIQPVVRQDVMDSLRELNADWRSTACPLSVNPSSEAFYNVQKPEVSMKTLFLENLSICKKTTGDVSVKENLKMHQNENNTNLMNPRRESSQLKMLMPSPSKVRYDPFAVKMKTRPHFVGYRSLLGNQNPVKVVSARKETMSSVFKKRVDPLPPQNPTLPGLPKDHCRRIVFQKEIQGTFSKKSFEGIISKIESQKNQKSFQTVLQKNFSENLTKTISAINPSTKNKSQGSPPTQEPLQPSSYKSPQKSRIRVDSPDNLKLTRSARKRAYEARYSKDVPSTSQLNSPIIDIKPRIIRRKQSLALRPGCSNPPETEPVNISKRDEQGHPQEKSRKTTVTGNTRKVDGSCSSPKKQKIASEIPESSKLVVFSNPNSGKPGKSHVPPLQGIQTIILTDSSDEEQPVRKADPAKRATKKCTPIRRSARQKSKGQVKTVLLKNRSTRRSSSSVANVSKTPVPVNRVPKRINSFPSRNPRDVLSDPESEEVSSDSEAEAPRYVSRTGRSVGISTGCRSCPGCKIDRPRKEKPKPKPVRKKRYPDPVSPNEDSDDTDSEFYTDIVRADSEELVEDTSQTPESPPVVVIHGLTSSESSDDELLVLQGGRTALVVVPDEDGGEELRDSPSGSEIAEEVVETHVYLPVTGVSGNPVETVSKRTDFEGTDHSPDADVPMKFSEGVQSSLHEVAPTKQQLNGKRSKGSASPTNHIHETHENSQDVTEAVPPVIINDVVSDGSSSSQIPAISKPHEKQNVKTDMDDQKADGLPNSLHSPSEVQCYLSHHDTNGTLLLHEINSESSGDYIPRENDMPKFQNENASSLGDGLCVPSLVDISSESETSDSIVNFDSQEYAECESTCSSQAGSMPEDSCQGVSVVPDCGSENCDGDSSSVGDKLCSTRPFVDGDPQEEDSKMSKDISKSPKRDGETPRVTQEDKVATGRQTFVKDLAYEHGPLLSRITESCIGAQDGQIPEESSSGSSSGVPCPGDMEKPQGEARPSILHSGLGDSIDQDGQTPSESSLEVALPGDMKKPQRGATSIVPHTELLDSVDQDSLNANECQDCSQDITASLPDSASQGDATTYLETITRKEDSVIDSSLVLDMLPQVDGTSKMDEVQACERGDAAQDAPLQKIVEGIPPESSHSLQGSSTSTVVAVIGSAQFPLQGSSTITPDVSDILQDSPDESDRKSGTLFQNETSATRSMELYASNPDDKGPSINNQSPECPSSRGDLCGVPPAHKGDSGSKSETMLQNETSETADQDCQIRDGSHNVLEIHMLEGCPSCRDICQDLSTNQTPLEHPSSPRDRPERPPSPGDSANCGVRQSQRGNFYHAISNLLIDCLNNMVESVKLENREVIIKKVNPESPDALETDPAAQEAELAAENLESVLKELNLSVSLNPRLTVKKLTSIPRAANSTCEVNCASDDSTAQESPSDGCASDDNWVPENPCHIPNTTPSKSLYERKGCPTPIKRLDPTVLSVIKYNDLEIYNDEPSLNDPPDSDRVECVSSKGIRLELGPEELANIENLLNTKISHLRDKGIKIPGSGGVESQNRAEIDELVIYNDEPPLNVTPVKCWEKHLPSPDDEDLGELVIDNDAPPLNEPINDAPPPAIKPALNDPECMIISSDDEVVMASEPMKELLQPEVSSTLQEASDNLLERPRKKRFRKRRNSKSTIEASSISDLQRSQTTLRGEDPHDYSGAGSQQILDLSELDCHSDDIIDEVVIDDSGAETFQQPSWQTLPPFQNCREVLHQPQVFNHQGQPLLNLGPSGHIIDHNSANSRAAASSKNAPSTSQVTFDLSETFHDSQEMECLDISDSDILTASECGDEVVVVSPLKTSSHVQRFIEMQKNGRDEVVVQSVDTDSDDDVIVMSGPDKVRPANNRFQHFPSAGAPSPDLRAGVHAQGRKVTFTKPYAFPQIRRNAPAPFTTRRVKTVLTPSGKSYLVLVVPPKAPA